MLWLDDKEVKIDIPCFNRTCLVKPNIANFLIEQGISTTEGQDTDEIVLAKIVEFIWESNPSHRLRLILEKQQQHHRENFKYPEVYTHFLIAEGQVSQAELNAYKAKNRVKDWLGEVFNIPGKQLEIGCHECVGSPIRVCVYNNKEDRMHDFCLYCGWPEERK